jgi:hypothetical protein
MSANSEILKLFPALPLGLLLPSLDIGRSIEQAPGVVIGHLMSLACLRKLALKKGDPVNKALYLLLSNGVIPQF